MLLLMLWYMTKLSLVTLPTFLAFSHNQGMNNQVNYAKSNLVTLMRCLKAALEWQVAHHERWLRNHPSYEHEIEFLGNSVPKKWQQCHLESALNITKDVTNFVCCDFNQVSEIKTFVGPLPFFYATPKCHWDQYVYWLT